MNRREFIKKTGTTVGTIPFLSIITTNYLYASSSPIFGEYKAVVVLQLDGGNDHLNTFIPVTDYATYKKYRGKIAIKDKNLFDDENYGTYNADTYFNIEEDKNPYNATVDGEDWTDYIPPEDNLEASYRKGVYTVFDKDDASKSMGMNSMMPELADLFKKNRMSIVSNVGTLVEPITREEFNNETKEVPLFLFAHDHQRRAVQTAKAQDMINSGWLGRLSDSWGVNGDVGLNISYDGLQTIVTGKETIPFMLRKSPVSYTNSGIPNFLIDVNDNTSSNNIFDSYYKKLHKISANLSNSFEEAWENAPTFTSKNSYGEPIFTTPDPIKKLKIDIHLLDNKLFTTLESVAKMVKIGRDTLGFKRQVFYIKLGGFDFHSGQMEDQTIKLRTLSLAISDFYKALEEMGFDDKVVLATTSDFGRTILSNGDGTDHAWASNGFIVSGAPDFQGGKILGDIVTDFELDGTHCIHRKGRLVPTTSIEQMYSPIMDWFGVDAMNMKNMFPNLSNFRTVEDEYKSAFLSGVFSS